LTRALFLQAAGLTNKQRHIVSRRLERGPVMFDLARDVIAGAYRGNPRLPALPDAGGREGPRHGCPRRARAGRRRGASTSSERTQSPQPASARGLMGFPPVRHISDISTCPNRTMPLQKFFDAGTVADDWELTISVYLCLATARANKVISVCNSPNRHKVAGALPTRPGAAFRRWQNTPDAVLSAAAGDLAHPTA
jgi:hypothetical protein